MVNSVRGLWITPVPFGAEFPLDFGDPVGTDHLLTISIRRKTKLTYFILRTANGYHKIPFARWPLGSGSAPNRTGRPAQAASGPRLRDHYAMTVREVGISKVSASGPMISSHMAPPSPKCCAA